MNLLSPIKLLLRVLLNTLVSSVSQPISLAEVNEEILKTTLNSIEVIHSQSNGMMNFVNNYRKLSRIPRPKLIPFETDESDLISFV